MLLAGVVMKLGAYGCLRVAMVLFPDGARMWQNEIAALAVHPASSMARECAGAEGFQVCNGYSSVSHMGFVLLGLATLNDIGLSGAVLQMFSHGIIAGLLFAVVGRMVYDRTPHARFRRPANHATGPAAAVRRVTFVLAGIASMGLPGFSGFVAELQVLMGAWKVFPKAAILAGVGIVVGAAYTLRAMQKAFYSDAPPKPSSHDHPAGPISLPNASERRC